MADANGVAVPEQLSPYRYAIHERPVVAIQVDQVEGGIGLADGEVLSRDRAVVQAQVVGGIASDGKLAASQPYDRALRRTRNHHDSRIHGPPPGC